LPLHRAPRDLSALAPFLRPRDAEPDRVRRHLSAARSAAGPLHVPHLRRISQRTGRGANRRHDHERLRGGAQDRAGGRADPRSAEARAADPGRGARGELRGSAGTRFPPRARERPLRARLGELGRGPARRAVHRAGSEGARGAPRTSDTRRRGREGRRALRAASPDHSQLQRGSRRDFEPRHHPEAPRDHSLGRRQALVARAAMAKTSQRLLDPHFASKLARLDTRASTRYYWHALTKSGYADRLPASLASLILRQKDAVGMYASPNGRGELIPPRSTPSHLRQLLVLLERLEAAGGTDFASSLHALAERVKQRGLIVILSDLLDDTERIASAIHHFRHRKHEVLVFHVLDPQATTFQFEREATYIDLESGDRVTTRPQELRVDYRSRVKGWMDKIREFCVEKQADYVAVSTDTPYDRALLEYLSKRARLL